MAKIDVGSGQLPREGYFGLDIVHISGVDCVCDMRCLPLGDGAIEEVYSCHALEHLTHQGGIVAAKEMLRVLAPGGRVEIRVPDLEAHIIQYLEGDTRHAMAGLYGWQSYVGDVHLWNYSYRSLCALLRQTGFVEIQRLDDLPYWLSVEAYKEIR